MADLNEGSGTTTVTNHRFYDTFGILKSETNAAVDLIFGFTAKLFDDVTGQQHNWQRWYDAVLSKWTSEDPSGFRAGDTNLSRYVGNNATNLIDPTGLVEFEVVVDYAPGAQGINVDSAGWYRAVLSGDQVGQTTLKRQISFEIATERRSADNGGDRYMAVFKVYMESHIHLDIAAIDRKKSEFRGLTYDTAYAHEQRHLRNYLSIVYDQVRFLEEAEKIRWDTRSEAAAMARAWQADVEKIIDKKALAEKDHQGKIPPSPRKMELPVPIGTRPPPLGDMQP